MTTALIIDDEIDTRLLVRTVIEFHNDDLRVVGEASDGLEAIDVWHELNRPPPPDVVILDHRMPGLTGLEVAAQILAERPDQLVVLFSAFLDAKIRQEAAGVGVATCVQKDDVRALPAVIRRLTAV